MAVKLSWRRMATIQGEGGKNTGRRAGPPAPISWANGGQGEKKGEKEKPALRSVGLERQKIECKKRRDPDPSTTMSATSRGGERGEAGKG